MKKIKKKFDWNDIESQKLFMNVTNEFKIEERFVNEAKNLVQTFNINRKDKILDFACGNGKHAIEIAKMGYKIHGYDKSSLYIDNAYDIASKHKVDIEFYCEEKKLKLNYEKYKFIYTINFPISYFDKKEITDISRIIYDLLEENGLFLLGFPYTREDREINLPSNSWKEDEEGIIHLSESKIEENGIRIERYIKIEPKKDTLTEWVDECKYYYLNEIKDILEIANLKPIECYENLTGSISKEPDKVHFILCKKI